MCHLIQTCFSKNPTQRPNFADIKQNIKSICDALFKSVQQSKTIYENAAESSYASIKSMEKTNTNNMRDKYMQLQNWNNMNSNTSTKEEKKEGRYENMFGVKCISLTKINGTKEDTNISITPLDIHNLESQPDNQGICLDAKGYTPMTPRKKIFPQY